MKFISRNPINVISTGGGNLSRCGVRFLVAALARNDIVWLSTLFRKFGHVFMIFLRASGYQTKRVGRCRSLSDPLKSFLQVIFGIFPLEGFCDLFIEGLKFEYGRF